MVVYGVCGRHTACITAGFLPPGGCPAPACRSILRPRRAGAADDLERARPTAPAHQRVLKCGRLRRGICRCPSGRRTGFPHPRASGTADRRPKGRTAPRRRMGRSGRAAIRHGGSHRIGRMPPEALLEVRDLCIDLIPHRGILRGVSFDIPKETIAGLSGDSGSGKTTLALALLKLLPPARYRVGGRVLLRGRDLLALDETALEAVLGAEIAMLFQDPLLALNPVL